jgi:hypothetical protein
MAAAANKAIGNALLHGSHAMLSPPRSEVGFVAAVTPGRIRTCDLQLAPVLQEA